jgi:hypothetical protein
MAVRTVSDANPANGLVNASPRSGATVLPLAIAANPGIWAALLTGLWGSGETTSR